MVNEHLHVKEADLEHPPRGCGGSSACNTAEAVKDATTRERGLVTRLTTELARIADARAKATTALTTTSTTKTRTRLEAELAGHTSTECALRDHVTLGRWLRQTPTGRLVHRPGQVAAEAKLDGKYLLSTSDPHLTPAQVALGYKNLLEAERGFRDLKSTLMLRPVFHRLEPRIRAHVLICWLALLLVRVAENAHRHHLGPDLPRDGPPAPRSPSPAPPGPSSRPPSPPTSNAPFLGPATCPRHPGSPPLTPR